MPLRFLADENCDFAVVHALRALGYDVLAVSEVKLRSVDSDLIEQSAREQRILITEDKDFGWLVFVSRAESAGVIPIRFPGNARETLVQSMTLALKQHGDVLTGSFTVLQPGHIRISSKPRPQA